MNKLRTSIKLGIELLVACVVLATNVMILDGGTPITYIGAGLIIILIVGGLAGLAIVTDGIVRGLDIISMGYTGGLVATFIYLGIGDWYVTVFTTVGTYLIAILTGTILVDINWFRHKVYDLDISKKNPILYAHKPSATIDSKPIKIKQNK